MDGAPNPKTKKWRGQLYSETRYAVIQWLERELPLVIGDVINISAGNWDVPKKLLNMSKVTSYITFDLPTYSGTKNNVNVFGDVHNMPKEWTNKWDYIINSQALECYKDPFKAMGEMYRILKPGGILLLDVPFAYRWFGKGSWYDEKQNKKEVKDYYRFTRDGLELLTKAFKSVKIDRSGPNKYAPYCYMLKAVK